jgi:DNA-binding HxlR family transcriptional regulator
MEEEGIVKRKVFPTIPVQVEYSVTKYGETLYPILEMMCDWGSRNVGTRYEVINKQCCGE